MKEKVLDKILTYSNSYSFYKDFYRKHNKKSNVVGWDEIFKYLSRNDEMFDVTLKSIPENFKHGNKMKKCPICNHKMPIFVAGGVKYRPNAMCPVCNSLERHRFLYFFIKNKCNIKNNMKILHFAPEKAFYDIFENLNNIEYYTADIEKSPYVKQIMDIQDIPFEDNFFDLIICNHVLEHVSDDKKAMKELYRTVKSNSTNGVIVMVPIDFKLSETLENDEYNTPELRKKYFGQHDHVRMYGMDVSDRLRSVGFNVEIFDYTTNLVKNPRKYGFNKEDVIFYCTKD